MSEADKEKPFSIMEDIRRRRQGVMGDPGDRLKYSQANRLAKPKEGN